MLELLPQAGCWERHLLCKVNNFLFPEDRRNPGAKEMLQARQQDQQDRQMFAEQFHLLVTDAMALKPNVPSEVVLQLKERMEKLSILGSSIGPSVAKEITAIYKLHSVVAQTIAQSIGEDTLAKTELENEAAAFELHQSLLQHPLVAMLLRPESPILENELVPTLLSEENPECLAAVLCLFDEAQLGELRQEATALLSSLTSAGKHMPLAWNNLEILKKPPPN